MIFLVAYDRQKQALMRPVEAFEDTRRAEAGQRRLELQLALPIEDGRFEVVLLEAKSFGIVQLTHARYFADSAAELAEDARSEAARRIDKVAERTKRRGATD